MAAISRLTKKQKDEIRAKYALGTITPVKQLVVK